MHEVVLQVASAVKSDGARRLKSSVRGGWVFGCGCDLILKTFKVKEIKKTTRKQANKATGRGLIFQFMHVLVHINSTFIYISLF